MFKKLSILAVLSSLLIPLKAEAANCTSASFYGLGDGFHGRLTASGQTFNAYGNTVAHPWLPFGTRLRVTNPSTGRSVVVRVNDRGPFVASRGMDMSYGSFASISTTKNGGDLVYQKESVNVPVEVFSYKDGKEIGLSKANDKVVGTLDVSRPLEFWTNSRGKKVRSILVKPANFDPKKKYPLFVLMHGGPASSFKDAFGYRWNPYVLASDKMVIVMTDYTGSVGYGEKFAQDIQFDPFKGPGQEILDASRDAIKRFDFIDESRQAAGGASYGGHLANWMQATTTHFKCLVSHAGLMNSEEQWGTSDVIWGRELMNGGAPWVPTKTWKEQNPMRFAANFKTPILYTVGENDFRVPINNTLTSWSITQRLKIPAKLIVFPEENHWILKPENSRFHYREIMGWLEKYL